MKTVVIDRDSVEFAAQVVDWIQKFKTLPPDMVPHWFAEFGGVLPPFLDDDLKWAAEVYANILAYQPPADDEIRFTPLSLRCKDHYTDNVTERILALGAGEWVEDEYFILRCHLARQFAAVADNYCLGLDTRLDAIDVVEEILGVLKHYVEHYDDDGEVKAE